MTDDALPLCEYCSDPVPPPDPERQIVASGGWCMPAGNLYALTEPRVLCVDCRSREMMIMELGIDPGRHGENLSIQRGGIQYPKVEA